MTGWAEQIVIVTGGSRGIGRANSRALAARGAAICINYATRAVEAEAAAGEIAATGGRVIAVQADVADADAVARMVARTEAELGPVGILVNNAGYLHRQPWTAMTRRRWRACGASTWMG
jgi:3-oxoacyl-[acyl-carrier protein] reductase